MNNKQNIFTHWLGLILVCSLCVGLPQSVAANLDEEAVMDDLMAMDFSQLGEVKVKLDDVFDVFDGLIKGRKVKVATGETQDMSKAPSVTTVITAQDIEAMGARDLDEVLEAVPGLHVSKNNISNFPIYQMRGITSTFNPETLVLINGISVKDSYIGSRNLIWAGMPVNSIARIEVIRGPGSAVFGADAFSGVINIITKTKQDIEGTETGVRVGSFDAYEGWLLHGENYGGIDLALMMEYTNAEGHREIIEEDAQTQFDTLSGTQASLAPGAGNHQLTRWNMRLDAAKNNWRFRAAWMRSDEIGTGFGLGEALDPVGLWGGDMATTDLTWHNPHLTRFWDVSARVSYFYNSFEPQTNHRIFPSGTVIAGELFPEGYSGNPGRAEEQITTDIFGFYSGIKDHLLRFGAGYYYGDMYKVTESKNFGPNPAGGLITPTEIVDVSDTPFVYLPEVMRTAWYINAQDIWHINDTWELTVGVRYDKYSDFGSTVNPRAALVWSTTEKLTTKLLYGQAFRAPSFIELYNQNNPFSNGNPDLKPENIETFELAFDYLVQKNLHADINFFYYKMDDRVLLEPNPDMPGFLSFANGGQQKGKGMELELRWKPSVRSSLLLNYAYQKSTDKMVDYDVGYAPTHEIYMRGDWLLMSNWFLDARVNWVADRKRSFGDTRDKVNDYTTVDLTLRYKNIRGGHWNAAVGVRNLFDADVREPSQGTGGIVNIPNDLPQAGRDFFAELRYSFK